MSVGPDNSLFSSLSRTFSSYLPPTQRPRAVPKERPQRLAFRTVDEKDEIEPLVTLTMPWILFVVSTAGKELVRYEYHHAAGSICDKMIIKLLNAINFRGRTEVVFV